MTNKSTNSEYIGSKLVIDKELHQKLDEILNREHEEVTESHDEIIALVREHDAKSSFAVTGIGKEIRADERQRCVERAYAAIESIKEDESYDKGFVNDVAASHNASLSDAQLALLAEFTDK